MVVGDFRILIYKNTISVLGPFVAARNWNRRGSRRRPFCESFLRVSLATALLVLAGALIGLPLEDYKASCREVKRWHSLVQRAIAGDTDATARLLSPPIVVRVVCVGFGFGDCRKQGQSR